MNWPLCGSLLFSLLHTQPNVFCTSEQERWITTRVVIILCINTPELSSNVHLIGCVTQNMRGNELLGGALHFPSAFTVIFCFKLQRNKVALVVSQHQHGGGQHGKEELRFEAFGHCFAVRQRVGSRGEWRAGLQKVRSKAEQMCFQSPSSPQPWTGLCVYSWPQRTSVLHSSQQLAAVLSQAASVCPSPRSQGQKNTAEIRLCLKHSIWRKCVPTVKSCLNP